MKISIITVFNTENCGSVLQALALKTALEKKGAEVLHISTKNRLSAHSFRMLTKNMLKSAISFSNPLRPLARYVSYDRFIKRTFTIDKADGEKSNIVIIGSDTVWDVTSPYFLLSQDVFWAKNIDGNKVIVYGASIADSPYDRLDNLVYPPKFIKGFRAVSVRDRYTEEYVSSVIGKAPQIVCDPTFLISDKEYERFEKKIDEKDFLLLYLFNEPSMIIADKIKEFTREKGLMTIALGKNISFADKYVISSIENFLGYYKSASYVITNTFHGTVFSLINQKKFVALDYNKNKVKNLLELTKTISHLVSDESNISRELDAPVDYQSVNNILEEIRSASMKFIEVYIKSGEEK